MSVNILNKKYNKSYSRNVSEIEYIVDELILKNKGKLDKTYLNSINPDKFFSKKLVNKGIFYFKKDVNKNDNKLKKYSSEIITRARKNLGEKSFSKKIYDITPELEIEKKAPKSKTKIWSWIGKNYKTKINKDKNLQANNITKSEELNKNLLKIQETYIPKITYSEDKEKKISKVKIKNKKTGKHLKPGFFNIAEKNKKLVDIRDKDVLEIDKKDKSRFNDLDNNLEFSDQCIKRFGEKDLSNNYKKEEKKSRFITKKNNFFKKTIYDKKSEYIDNESIDINSEYKPFFKIENVPDLSEEEKNLIDEDIKKNIDKKSQANDYKKEEEKLHISLEEHIKEINDNSTEKSNEKHQKDIEFNFAENTDSKQEYVFFDEQEQDSDFNGWNPDVVNKEHKEIHKNIINEINNQFIGEVNDIELPKESLSIKSMKLSDLGFSENEWEELDFYPLVEPYAYVEILKERENLEKRYFLVEANISEEEQKIMDFIYDTISNMSMDTEDFEIKGERDYLIENIKKVIKDYSLKVDKELFNKILYNLSKSSLGLGKIDPLIHDPNIEDISCDGNNLPIFVYHRKFGSLKSNIQFDTGDELNSFVNRLAQKCGKHISIAEPMLDATMPDGSRIQMTLSDEITTHGSTFTIRKFRADPFSPTDLFEFNTMSSEMIAYMWMAVENRINMLFSGGTASGKTTSLNALSLFIPSEAKIVSIEETREITLPHPNWIPGVSRSGFGQVIADKVVGEIDTYDLMKAALRQRPEYIIVGEIRGREAYVLFQAMATGHATYSTVHADSANSLIHRLEGKPIEIPRVMLQALDVVSIHIITSVKGKRARRCKQIIEIIDIDPTTKEIMTNEVFRWDPIEDKFIFSGKSYILERIRIEKDMSLEDMIIEMKRRKKIVELMSKGNVRLFSDVARLVSRYSENPEKTFNELEKVIKK